MRRGTSGGRDVISHQRSASKAGPAQDGTGLREQAVQAGCVVYPKLKE
jgi:hypothetical protein